MFRWGPISEKGAGNALHAHLPRFLPAYRALVEENGFSENKANKGHSSESGEDVHYLFLISSSFTTWLCMDLIRF